MPQTRPETEQLIKVPHAYKNKRVAVISHVRPDADCIGSQVGLCRWLKAKGVEALAFNDDTLPPNVTWIGEYFPIRQTSLSQMATCDAIVFVDGKSSVQIRTGRRVRREVGQAAVYGRPPSESGFPPVQGLRFRWYPPRPPVSLIYEIYERDDFAAPWPGVGRGLVCRHGYRHGFHSGSTVLDGSNARGRGPHDSQNRPENRAHFTARCIDGKTINQLH